MRSEAPSKKPETHVAEQMVNEVPALENSVTNLPNSPDGPKQTVVPFLLAHLNFSLGPC